MTAAAQAAVFRNASKLKHNFSYSGLEHDICFYFDSQINEEMEINCAPASRIECNDPLCAPDATNLSQHENEKKMLSSNTERCHLTLAQHKFQSSPCAQSHVSWFSLIFGSGNAV